MNASSTSSKTLLFIHNNYKYIQETLNDLLRIKDIVSIYDSEEEETIDRSICMADYIVFILNSTSISTAKNSELCKQQILLANTLSKECIYVFLEQGVFDYVKKLLDFFKYKFEDSFKIHFYEDKFDDKLIDDIKMFITKKDEDGSSLTDSDSDIDNPDEKPFRIGSYKTRCKHGLTCYCYKPRPKYWS